MNYIPGMPRDTTRAMMFGGGSSSPSGSTTVNASSDPWSGQQGFLRNGYEAAQNNILNRPTSFYPNSTVVPFSNQTNAALQGIENYATQPNSVINNAQSNLSQTLNGDFLNSNPYLQQMIQQTTQAITPALDAKFAGSGRYGSGAHANALASAAADAGTRLGYQNYNDERQNQLKAQVLAPQTYNLGLSPYQSLAGVGGAMESKAGETLQDQINRYNYAQNEPTQRTGQYVQAITQGGVQPGTQTTQQPYFMQPAWQQALGAGLGLAGTTGMLFGNNGAFPGVLQGLFK